ncbi:MAG TPA: hypothetical protein VGD55_08435 [Acidothermaceae bacterium]
MTAPAYGHDEPADRHRPAEGSLIGSQLRAQLLERFERQIDLPAWVVAQGFHVSPVQKDPTKLAFADRHGDTLLLTKDLSAGRWLYQTAGEPVERGSIVDLMKRRDGSTLDECLERMAECADLSKRSREAEAYRQASAEVTLRRAVDRHVAAQTVECDAEKGLERLGVEKGAFDGWRFGAASLVLKDPPELAHSRYRESDRAMVIIERPIDAIAYERTHGKQHATYIYVGDNPSDETKRKLAHVIADAPANLTVVAAVAKDRRGTALAEEIADIAGRRPVERRAPEFGSRWADQMQIEGRHRASLARLHQQPDAVLENVRRGLAKALDAGVDVAQLRTAIVRRPSKGLDR